MQEMNNQDYTYHGTMVKATELVTFMEHLLEVNLQLEIAGKPKTPLCIWGRHGVGKTAIVRELAQVKDYPLVEIAPAQFEEMGDLLGMPFIEGNQTVFKAPSWVPTQEGPGILLIDDINRADDRILRGLMQLLQNYALVSWTLPQQWQIICTANPDGGDYSVTPLDDALLTRMMHVSLQFDVKEWAKWAEKEKIDSRGINFVLTYPEVIKGEKTTARTLVQFFEAIRNIEDLSKQLPFIQLLGDSCLDEVTVSAFIAFVNQNLAALVTPQELINSTDFHKEILPNLEHLINQQNLRVDILATLSTRITNYLAQLDEKVSPLMIENIKHFLKIDWLPNDLRYAMAKEILALEKPQWRSLLADPEIGQVYMGKM